MISIMMISGEFGDVCDSTSDCSNGGVTDFACVTLESGDKKCGCPEAFFPTSSQIAPGVVIYECKDSEYLQ